MLHIVEAWLGSRPCLRGDGWYGGASIDRASGAADGQTPMTYINLPAFADVTLLALLIANSLVCLVVLIMAGPTFIAARDAFGRHVVEVPIWKRLLLALSIFALAAYLALQALLVWQFGVTREIYRNVMIGDQVEVRFRAADDTLFELTVVERAQP